MPEERYPAPDIRRPEAKRAVSGEWSRKAHERARGNQVVSDEAQPRPPAWNLVQCREAESEWRRCRYAKANFGGLRNGKSQLRSEGAAARQQAEPCRKRGFGLQTARETGSALPRLRGQLAKGATQILHTLRIADAFVRCVERQVQCSSGRHQNLYRDPGDIHRLGLRRKHPPDIARCDTNAPKAPMEIDSGVISRSLPGTGGGIPLIGHRVDDGFDILDARLIRSRQPDRTHRRIGHHVGNGLVGLRGSDVELPGERRRRLGVFPGRRPGFASRPEMPDRVRRRPSR